MQLVKKSCNWEVIVSDRVRGTLLTHPVSSSARASLHPSPRGAALRRLPSSPSPVSPRAPRRLPRAPLSQPPSCDPCLVKQDGFWRPCYEGAGVGRPRHRQDVGYQAVNGAAGARGVWAHGSARSWRRVGAPGAAGTDRSAASACCQRSAVPQCRGAARLPCAGMKMAPSLTPPSPPPPRHRHLKSTRAQDDHE